MKNIPAIFYSIVVVLLSVCVNRIHLANKECSPAYCYYEGSCTMIRGQPVCQCIDESALSGPYCNITIDYCTQSNLCTRGRCVNIAGQAYCEDCPPGVGGQFCERAGLAPNGVLLLYNRYGRLGQEHLFIFTVVELGNMEFMTWLSSERYAIEMFTTESGDKNGWSVHHKLNLLAHQKNIQMWKDIPYEEGYYHISKQTFWHAGIEKLQMAIYIAGVPIYEKNFQLLIAGQSDASVCIPIVAFPFQTFVKDWLTTEVSRYSIFEAIVGKRCREDSVLEFHWSLYNMIGTKLLKQYPPTYRPLLKVEPYVFTYIHNIELQVTRIVLNYIEYTDDFYAESSEICYVRIQSKPVKAIIGGGLERQINVDKAFYIDGRGSRDFLYPAGSNRHLIFRWLCLPADNFKDPDCMLNMGNFAVMKYPPQFFLQAQKYLIVLMIRSRIFGAVDISSQLVYVSKIRRLEVFIDCIRNCANQQFYRLDSIHLRARCTECIDFHATRFEWDTSIYYNRTRNIRGRQFRLLFNVGPYDPDIVRVTLIVHYKGLQGSHTIVLRENIQPKFTDIDIRPRSGIAFNTIFILTYRGISTTFTYLYYEMHVHDYLYVRTYKPSYYLRLPPTDLVLLKGCDTFGVCDTFDIRIRVMNPMSYVNLLIFKKYCQDIKNLIEDGFTSEAFLMTHTLAEHIKSVRHLKRIVSAIQRLKVMTLAEIRNMLILMETLTKYSSPLTYKHVKILCTCLRMIRKGLEFVLKDNEHRDIERTDLVMCVQKLLLILNMFATKTEKRSLPRILREPAIKIADPLAEDNEPPFVIDTEVLRRVHPWLMASMDLHKCLHIFGLIQNNIVFPKDPSIIIRFNDSVMYLDAFDPKLNEGNLIYNLQTTNLVLPNSLLAIIGTEMNCDEAGIQVGALVNKDAFWWVPATIDISSDELYISVYPKNSFKMTTKPINFHSSKLYIDMIMKASTSRRYSYIHGKFTDELDKGVERGVVTGIIPNDHIIIMYVMEIPPRAMLYVTFRENSNRMKIKLTLRKRAKARQIQRGGDIIEANSKENRTFSILNVYKKRTEGYLAVMVADKETTNATFKFGALMHQCLTWSFQTPDPEWTTNYCTPKGVVDIKYMRCECEHLSIFSARFNPVIISEDLDTHYLLDELPFNWHHLLVQASLFLIVAAVVSVAMIRLFMRSEILLTSIDDPMDRRLHVRFMSGGHRNSTTTSNIRLSIISEYEHHNVIVYQDCINPQLRQNSTCEIYLPAFKMENKRPFTIVLSIMPAGRYPSWYCNQVVIKDHKYRKIYVYQVRQWFYPGTVHTLSDCIPLKQFREPFPNNLAMVYKRWYQFQPILGENVHDHHDQLESTCIWVWQFVITVCIVTIYYGRTTLENYEEEREIYRYVTFNMPLVLGLGAVTYLANILIHLLFAHLIFF